MSGESVTDDTVPAVTTGKTDTTLSSVFGASTVKTTADRVSATTTVTTAGGRVPVIVKRTTTAKNNVTTVTAKNTTTQNRATTTPSTTVNVPAKELTRDEVVAKIPATLKNTTVTYFCWTDPHYRMEKSALAEFEEKTGIKLVYEPVSANTFYDDLAARIAAGNSPDMVRNRYTDVYALANLQPIENSGFDFSDPVWDNDIVDMYTFNGKRYGMNTRNSPLVEMTMMYYNRKALGDAGLEDPYTLWKNGKWTWSKFWEMCEAFVQSKSGQSGCYGAAFEQKSAYVATRATDFIRFNTSTNQYVRNTNNPELCTAWALTKEKADNGLLVFGNFFNDFSNHKILFFASDTRTCRTLEPRARILKAQNYLGTVPMPTDNTTKYTPLFEATAFGIPKGAKNAAAVPYLVRYITDQQSYDMSDVYYDEQARIAVAAALARENVVAPFISERITSLADTPITVNWLSNDLQTDLNNRSSAINVVIAQANTEVKRLGGS